MNFIGSNMDGVLCVDRESRVTLINPAAQDLLGVKSLATLGKTLAELDGSADLIQPLRCDHEQVVPGRDLERTVEVHDSDRDLCYVKATSRPLRDHRGGSVGVVTYLRDVTAEFKSNQLKNQYLSIVAHELRTPLTGIKTFSTMLAKARLGDLSGRQQDAVDAIREQSIRLEQQIDKLVNLGYLDSDEHDCELDRVALRDVVEAAVAPFRASARERAVGLEIECPDIGSVRADRDGLRRVLQALIENAVKFSGEGGAVVVRVEIDGTRARFSIRDAGIGIDPRYQRRIFERFFQVEDPLTRHHGGAGLGLFVAEKILAAHGSALQVVSELGNGAEFGFEMPTQEEDPALVGSSLGDPPNGSG